MKTSAMKIIVCILLVAIVMVVGGFAAIRAAKYSVHDKERPNPPVITPPKQVGQPPSDAIVLFDGSKKTLDSKWESDRRGVDEVPWEIDEVNGFMEVSRKGGGIRTKKKFSNCQLHVEWCTPEGVDPKITDQKRSNSGVFLMDRYEVQVLDSYTDDNYKTNRTYADGQAAAMYGQHPPMVNVCRRPGQWQTYDISFLKPLFDENGKLVRKARITVLHNGVVVHNNLEIEGTTSHKVKAAYRAHPNNEGHIRLQDHDNPIRFRNIWIRELPEQPYLIK
jgi:hypothetical protein